jgi:hypothetical protein
MWPNESFQTPRFRHEIMLSGVFKSFTAGLSVRYRTQYSWTPFLQALAENPSAIYLIASRTYIYW